ncbi:unnamed protein product, partial [Rotaria sp. Silwood2]
QLTSSIQRSNELILLLQRNVWPAIEYLSVTNEELHIVLPINEGKSTSCIQLCKHDLHERFNGTRLRYLLICYLNLTDVVILLGSLTMPLLENMILVDLYDHIRTCNYIKQILDASPNLSHLVVTWKDFRDCSNSYLNLRHVNLILEPLCPEPTEYFNIDRLAQLVFNLRSLEISYTTIKLNENLVQFISKIIHRLDQLVYLIVNKDCLYQVKHEKRKMFKERLLAVGHDQLFDCNNIKIKFRRYD